MDYSIQKSVINYKVQNSVKNSLNPREKSYIVTVMTNIM